MNITIVSDVLGEENNGTTIVTLNLYNYLKKQGNNVSFLCADQAKIGQEGYFVVPNLNVGPFNGYVKKNGVTLAKVDKDVVYEAIKDADLVYIMIPLSLGAAAAKMAYEMDKPLIAGFHMQAQNLSSHIFMQNVKAVNKFIYKYIYKHVFRYLDAIHYPTEFIKNDFESNIKRKTNGYVISNGIHSYVKKMDIPKPLELEDKIVVLSTGRYAKEKDQITLIKAMKYSKHKDKIELILAGKGPMEKKYRKTAKKVGINPIFKFYDRHEIIEVLNYCDIYVHPAVAELEGIACLEAMCIGKLTIVSDSKNSATKNFAAGPNCIFKHRKPKDLARVIDYYIDNPEEKREMEEIYLSQAGKYDQEKCMEKMGEMVLEVVKNHKKKNV
ncbi:MAG: glycosyltransferase [Anaeroplasmataceae bacterium]